ncbi:MAG TPA: hypothetical protein VM306_04085 [Lentzea sp.]|nr:hypothetical protein [Lentzea sp.]HUQ54804.1 hypothetical protein [Lentzea sp.]
MFAVIDVNAMIVPTKSELVPRVAELPTCQNTLQALAPLIKLMVLLEAVINVVDTWKIQTVFGSPCPSRVSVPDSPTAPGAR